MPVPPARPVVSVSRKAHFGGGALGDGAVRKRIQQIVRQFRQVRDIDAAVAAVALPELLGFEVLPKGRADHLAAHQVLNEGSARGRDGGPRACRRRTVRVLAVDAGHVAPERGELVLYILHASLFLCTLYRTPGRVVIVKW